MAIVPVLNINEFDFTELKGDFYANRFSEHLSTYHASITKPHKHNFYLTVLFLQGSGIHEVDFNAYPIQPGSVFFLRPGQTHYWELSDNIDGYIFFHSNEFFELFFPNRRLEDYPIFHKHYGSAFVQLGSKEINLYFKHFRDIYTEYESNRPFAYQRFALLVDLLYTDFSRRLEEQKTPEKIQPGKESEWLLKLQLLVDNHFITEKQPSYYADKLNISVKHLNKMIKLAVGKSSRDLIHERIILEAKRLLTHGNANVQEIALELGYDDTSYFSRFFKSKTNTTPVEFAKQYQKRIR